MDIYKKLNIIDKIISNNKQSKILWKALENCDSCNYYFLSLIEDPYWFDVLKNKKFFLPKNNPSPIQDKKNKGYKIPEWSVLQYLEKISKKTRKLDDNLINIIKDVSFYKDENGKHIDNYRTWWYFVKVLLNIPLSRIPYEIFEKAIPIWLTSIFDLTLPGSDLANDLLPTYLNQAKNKDDIKKVEKLVELLLSVKEFKTKKSVIGETVEIKTKIDNYWLEESFLTKNNAVAIAQKCTNVPIFRLANTIKEIFNKKYDKQDYSSIWLNNLTKEQKKSFYNDEYFLAVILRKLVLEKTKSNLREGKEIIEKFLSNAYPYYLFKRLGLLLIAENWDKYNNYFNQIIFDEKENYFVIDSFQPELSYLLLKNGSKLTKEQKIKIAKTIEKGPNKDLEGDRQEEYSNHWKQSWYKVLEAIPEFKKLYENLEKITKKKIVLKDIDNYGEMREVTFDKSSVSAEEFLTKSNEEIVKFINNYKPTGEFPNASPEGLYRTFQTAIELDPVKFTKNLDPFKINNYRMLSSFYSGLEEAWKQKKDILWNKVIDFTLLLIQKKWFWEPTKKDKSQHYDYFSWTLSAIGDLIQEGCKSDDWSFPEEKHEDIEKIITIFINKLSYNNDEYQGDGVSQALNTSWGKILIALIYLGLREARLSDKKAVKKKSKWSKSLKSNFEKVLDKKLHEAYTLLGQYLPNLHYIDKEWAETKAKKIHLIKDDKLFEIFMEGYLFTGKIYENIYKILEKSYEKALTIKFKEKRIQERLIQHITVGYLRSYEELKKDSLINKLIKMNGSEYVREIGEFLWHQRDYIVDENKTVEGIEKERVTFKKRIFDFWDYVINLFNKKEELNEEDKKALSELSKLAIYLQEIDQKSFERLMLSAPYVTYDFDSPYFIEYLNKLKERGEKKQSAKFVANLFLKMLKGAKDLIPDYKWENVEEIVNYLYQVGRTDVIIKDLANQICIFYAEHGNRRLREIYEKNN